MDPTLEEPNKQLLEVLGSGLTTEPVAGAAAVTNSEGRMLRKAIHRASKYQESVPGIAFPFRQLTKEKRREL